jgi:hypothetical protein
LSKREGLRAFLDRVWQSEAPEVRPQATEEIVRVFLQCLLARKAAIVRRILNTNPKRRLLLCSGFIVGRLLLRRGEVLGLADDTLF